MTQKNEWWMEELRKSTGGLRYKFQTITDVNIEGLLRKTAEESRRCTLESAREMVDGMRKELRADMTEKDVLMTLGFNAALDAVIEGLRKI